MSQDREKLYKVTCRGMTYSTTGVIHGVAYVVADNPHKAYMKLRNILDTEDLGFKYERELDRVELIAENYGYTDTKTLLIL